MQEQSILSSLHELLQANEIVRPLFVFFASSKRILDNCITIEKLLAATKYKIPRNEIVLLCKTLDRLDLLNFVAGRREFPSRITFYYTPASIGGVTLGLSDQLIRVTVASVPSLVRKGTTSSARA